MCAMSKPSIDMTEAELQQAIRDSTHTPYFLADWERELARRDAKHAADHQTRIAYIATAAAAISALTALVALLTR